MFKPGDLVKCVDLSEPKYDKRQLTLNKIYKVISWSGSCIEVLDDTGFLYGFYSRRFRKVKTITSPNIKVL